MRRLEEFIEYLEWRSEAKALSWHGVMLVRDGIDASEGNLGEVGFAWQISPEPSIHVLDAAFLPRAVRVAEVSFDREAVAEFVVEGKLGTVVLRESSPQSFGQSLEPAPQPGMNDASLARRRLGEEDEARDAFLGHEQVLADAAEGHDVGFPVTRLLAFEDVSRAFGNGNTVPDVIDRASTAFAEPAAAVLLVREQAVPVVALGGAEIGIAVDGLVADAHARLIQRQPAGDRFGRPSHRKFVSHETAQFRLARHFGAPLPFASTLHESVSPQRLIATRPLLRRFAVTFQLSRNRAVMAAQSLANTARRFTAGMPAVNLNPFLARKMIICLSHRNTTLAVSHLFRELTGSLLLPQTGEDVGNCGVHD